MAMLRISSLFISFFFPLGQPIAPRRTFLMMTSRYGEAVKLSYIRKYNLLYLYLGELSIESGHFEAYFLKFSFLPQFLPQFQVENRKRGIFRTLNAWNRERTRRKFRIIPAELFLFIHLIEFIYLIEFPFFLNFAF